MKEYTLIAVTSVIVVIIFDLVILKTKLVKEKKFWIFWAVMFMLLIIVNGYLTWRPIVTYNSNFFMNIRFFTIPLEDFLFGFSLISSNIILREFYERICLRK
ncbi:MAG: lycopene cyclase domain-containing protein [Ignavibacteria bacterium]|nr:lycopene cyclase domain-containing protein [Ignavibacteria bacterium]